MLTIPSERLDDRVLLYRPEDEGVRLTHAQFMARLASDHALRTTLSAAIEDAPFDAVRWETPGMSAATMERPFEFVLVDDPDLERPPERSAFEKHFRLSEEVVAFRNRSGDARLIVPCPRADDAVYVHLLSFLRGAPRPQVHALLARVGTELRERLARDPSAVWTSTAGAGVAWLHVRLDERPKYFHHAPYRRVP